MKFYVAIASAIAARNNCEDRANHSMAIEWSEYIDHLVKEHAPSGSGFDNGTTLNTQATAIGGRNPQRLVFDTSFHHLNEHGFYDGWTEHQVWVYPWFDGFDIRITGRNRNDIKEMIADTFHALGSVDVASFGDYRAARTQVQS